MFSSKRSAKEADLQEKPSKKPRLDTLNISTAGQPIVHSDDWSTSEAANIETLSHDMLSDFIDLLRERKSAEIEMCWKKTPVLRSWYLGQPVNVENKLRTISLEESVADFSLLLFTEATDIIRHIWLENTILKPWLRGEVVLVDGKFLCPADNAVLGYFHAILQSRIGEFIYDVWHQNARLHQLVKLLPVEEAKSSLRCLLLNIKFCDENIRIDFLNCLDKQDVIRPVLREVKKQHAKRPYAKFLTMLINVLDTYLTFSVFNSPLETINAFKNLLSLGDATQIEAMWNNEPLVRCWYKGEPLDFGIDQESDVRTITRGDLDRDFYLLLLTQAADTIKKCWKGSEILRQWYRGQSVKYDHAMLFQLTDITLVRHWSAVIQCPVYDVIRDVWVDNLRLYQVVRSLTEEQSSEILNNMLMNLYHCGAAIVSDFLQCIDNNVIVTVLNQLKVQDPQPAEQIALLEKHLAPKNENVLPDFIHDVDDYFTEMSLKY